MHVPSVSSVSFADSKNSAPTDSIVSHSAKRSGRSKGSKKSSFSPLNVASSVVQSSEEGNRADSDRVTTCAILQLQQGLTDMALTALTPSERIITERKIELANQIEKLNVYRCELEELDKNLIQLKADLEKEKQLSFSDKCFDFEIFKESYGKFRTEYSPLLTAVKQRLAAKINLNQMSFAAFQFLDQVMGIERQQLLSAGSATIEERQCLKDCLAQFYKVEMHVCNRISQISYLLMESFDPVKGLENSMQLTDKIASYASLINVVDDRIEQMALFQSKLVQSISEIPESTKLTADQKTEYTDLFLLFKAKYERYNQECESLNQQMNVSKRALKKKIKDVIHIKSEFQDKGPSYIARMDRRYGYTSEESEQISLSDQQQVERRQIKISSIERKVPILNRALEDLNLRLNEIRRKIGYCPPEQKVGAVCQLAGYVTGTRYHDLPKPTLNDEEAKKKKGYWGWF